MQGQIPKRTKMILSSMFIFALSAEGVYSSVQNNAVPGQLLLTEQVPSKSSNTTNASLSKDDSPAPSYETSNPSTAPSPIPSKVPSATPSRAPSWMPTNSPSAKPSISPSETPTNVPSYFPTKKPVPPPPTPTPLPPKHKVSFMQIVKWLFFLSMLAFAVYESYIHRGTIMFLLGRVCSEFIYRVQEGFNRIYRRGGGDEAERTPATLNEILFEEDSHSLNQAELSERLLG